MMGALTVAVIVLASVEVGYFVKTIVWCFGSMIFRARIHPLQPSTTYGIVTTKDVDFFLNHLNNARYLRSMDFGRVEHITRCRFWSAMKKLEATAVVASTVIRYRKPVYICTPYAVDTGIVYWDSRNIYYRQDIRTIHDNFIRSSAYVKLACVNSTPLQLLQSASHGCTVDAKAVTNIIRTSSSSTAAIREEQSCESHGKVGFVQLQDASDTTTEASGQLATEFKTDAGGSSVDFSLAGSGDVFEQFLAKPMPIDLASFIEHNELSSVRLKADKLVDDATKEALKRVKAACADKAKSE